VSEERLGEELKRIVVGTKKQKPGHILVDLINECPWYNYLKAK